MTDAPTYEVMAQAFVAEGVKVQFALMGTATMHWVTTLAQSFGVRTIHARHEHAAVAMAEGYHRATGEVGVASVTSGLVSRRSHALAVAAHGGVPLVVLAGDTPTNVSFHQQAFDSGPLARAAGARYVDVRHVDMLLDKVREAFWMAQFERCPVVLNVPIDFQKQRFPHIADYWSSKALLPTAQRPAPDPALIEEAVAMIGAAARPIIICGRGAVRSGAGPAAEALAEYCGALLGTSLLGKGLFDHNPYSLGVAGAFAGDLARELYAESDLVIGVGAGLGHYTTEAGYLYPNARVIHIDLNPRGLWQGLRTADLSIKADAKPALELLLVRLREHQPQRSGMRCPDLPKRLGEEAEHPDLKAFPETPGTVDPREAMLEIDRVVPRDWDVVVGAGHFFSIALTHMRNRPAERIHVTAGFGAIGSGLSTALEWQPRNDGKVLLLEGDGGLMMRAGTGNRSTAQHSSCRLRIQRRRIRGGGAQVPRRKQGSARGCPRPRRPRWRRIGFRTAFSHDPRKWTICRAGARLSGRRDRRTLEPTH